MTIKITHLIAFFFLAMPVAGFCQPREEIGFSVVIVDEYRQPISGATVRLLRNGKVVNSMVAGEDGRVVIGDVGSGAYRLLITSTGCQPKTTDEYRLPGVGSDTVGLLHQ